MSEPSTFNSTIMGKSDIRADSELNWPKAPAIGFFLRFLGYNSAGLRRTWNVTVPENINKNYTVVI